jgi:hypothetical protein
MDTKRRNEQPNENPHENHDEMDEPRNPSVEFDKSDLGARGILIFFVVLGLFAIAMQLIVLGMYAGMTRVADKHEPEQSPLAPKTVTQRSGILTNTADVNVRRFPEPRLQYDDTDDMARFLKQESSALTAEPWQDEQGNVHLPIEQAMRMVGSRLAVREGGGTALPNYPGASEEHANSMAQYETPESKAQDEKSGIGKPLIENQGQNENQASPVADK